MLISNEKWPFKIFFLVSFVFVIIGALMKLMHTGYSETVLAIGVILTIGYIIIGIMEVNDSRNIDTSEKIMWTVGFLFFLWSQPLYIFWPDAGKCCATGYYNWKIVIKPNIYTIHRFYNPKMW